MTAIRFLLDTNVLSEPLRPRPNLNVMRMLRQHQGEIATATVVWHELLFGCYRLPISNKRRIIEAYLTTEVQQKVPLLPYNAAAAEWLALERARLVAVGKTPPFLDGQIAAIAKVNHLILVTNNTSNYTDFQDLQLKNWFITK